MLHEQGLKVNQFIAVYGNAVSWIHAISLAKKNILIKTK